MEKKSCIAKCRTGEGMSDLRNLSHLERRSAESRKSTRTSVLRLMITAGSSPGFRYFGRGGGGWWGGLVGWLYTPKRTMYSFCVTTPGFGYIYPSFPLIPACRIGDKEAHLVPACECNTPIPSCKQIEQILVIQNSNSLLSPQPQLGIGIPRNPNPGH